MRVVYYHLISDSQFDWFNGLAVSKIKFEEDLKHYKKHYNVITFKDVKRYILQGKSLNNTLVITFDDGYKENFINAVEILDKYSLKATFFLNSSTINNEKIMWRDALTYLSEKASPKQLNNFKKDLLYSGREEFDILKSTKNLQLNTISKNIENLWNDVVGISQEEFAKENQIYIDCEDVRNLISSNHEIGIHSTYHPNFYTLSLNEGIEEIMTAYRFFFKKYNYEAISMSFPFGIKHPDKGFYDYLLKHTKLKYFSGIAYKQFSNTNLDKNHFVERLGMEDGRNFFLSFYLRPLIRLIK